MLHFIRKVKKNLSLSRMKDRYETYKKNKKKIQYLDYRKRANEEFSRLSASDGKVHEKNILVEALWDNAFHYPRVAMLHRALSESYGPGMIGVCLQRAKPEIVDSLNSLNPAKIYKVSDKVDEKYLEEGRKLCHGVTTSSELLNSRIKDYYPMHHFYDGILKMEAAGTLDDRIIEKLPYYYGLALLFIDQFNEVLDRENIQAVIVSHPTTMRFSALVACATNRGIPVFLTNYINEYISVRRFDHYSEIQSPDPNHYPESVFLKDLQPIRNEVISTGKSYYNKIMEGQASEFSRIKIHRGKKETWNRQKIQEALGLDTGKLNVVIMANCWFDFPNGLGPSYFTDYVDWFLGTLKLASENTRVNWVLKPHPAESLYNGRTTMQSLLRDHPQYNFATWPEGASTTALHDFADVVITARGSAGWEFTAAGRKVFVAAPSHYTEWGFCKYARSWKEYGDWIQNIEKLETPSGDDIEKALMYVAISQTAHPETMKNYNYPWGSFADQLWKEVPRFIAENRNNLKKEIGMMKRWAESGDKFYNKYKFVHADFWNS